MHFEEERTTASEPPSGADQPELDQPSQAGGSGSGQSDQGARTRLANQPRKPGIRHRYGALLLVLLASYLLSAFFVSPWLIDSQVVLFTAVLLLAIRNSRFRRTSRLAISAGLLTSVAIVIIVDRTGGPVGHGVAAIWTGLLLLITVVLLVQQILLMPEVTIQSIYGAVSTYLIIGLMFASFFTAMYWLGGMGFFAPSNEHLHSASDFQYFSFSTLTTLGYGDFTAYKSAGRAVAMIEAMTGQIFLATLVAKLVSSFRPAAPARDSATSTPGTEQ